jgi:hypothetical protein
MKLFLSKDQQGPIEGLLVGRGNGYVKLLVRDVYLVVDETGKKCVTKPGDEVLLSQEQVQHFEKKLGPNADA